MNKIVVAVLALPLSVCSMAQSKQEAVSGVVRDQKGEPLTGAVVEMEDEHTLQIRSFVTPGSGEYRFYGVEPNQKYRLRADYQGQWSKSRRLTRFNSGKPKPINLRVKRAGA